MAKKRKYGEAEVQVSIRDRVSAGLVAIERKMKGFAAGIGGVGRGLVGVGAAAVGVFGGLAGALAFPTQLAANLETTTVAFETMLGSAEKAQSLLGELRDFAASTPLSFDEISGAAKKLLAFGVASEDVTGTLQRIGDVASGIGAPIGEIAEIYGKARVQGRLFAEDINQLTGRGIPIIQELAKQFGVAESEVKKLVESGAVNFGHLEEAFRSMTGEGSQFGGMMAKQSQTLTGLLSTLRDNVLTALIPLGAAVAEVIKPIVTQLIAMVAPVSEMIRNNAGLAKVLMLVAASGTVLGVGLVALGATFIAFGAVVSAVGTIVGAVAAVFSVLSIPIIAVVAAVAASIALYTALGASLLYVASQAGILSEAYAFLGRVFGQLYGTVKTTFGGIMDALAAGQYVLAAKILWAGMKLAFFQGAAGVLDAFTYVWQNAWTITKRFFSQLLETTYSIFSKVPELMRAALTGGASFADILGDALTGNLDLKGAVKGQVASAQQELDALRAQAEQAKAAAARSPDAQQAAGGQQSREERNKQIDDKVTGFFDRLGAMSDAALQEERAKQVDQQLQNAVNQAAVQNKKDEEVAQEIPQLLAETSAQSERTKAIGTSSAAAVAAGVFGGGSRSAEDTARNTAITAQYVRQIAKRPQIGFGA